MSDIVIEDWELDKGVLKCLSTALLENSEFAKLQRESKDVCIGADVDEMGVEEDNDGGMAGLGFGDLQGRLSK